MTEEKIALKEEELDLVAGGLSWTCKHTGIGTESEVIELKTVLSVDYNGTPVTETTWFYGRGCSKAALEFMNGHKEDIFLTVDGKAFKP